MAPATRTGRKEFGLVRQGFALSAGILYNVGMEQLANKYGCINRDKVDLWKQDISESVDFYNRWFLSFAPRTFEAARARSAKDVANTFKLAKDCMNQNADTLLLVPQILPILRQMTCPPLARDRLAGLAGITPALVKRFELGAQVTGWPTRNAPESAQKIIRVINRLIDTDLLPWLNRSGSVPTAEQRERAALVIADRLCGALADPILRNSQEQRQLAAIERFLRNWGYRKATPKSHIEMKPGEFAFHLNIRVSLEDNTEPSVNIPVDVAILRKSAQAGNLPIIIEAKSAGDFANVNKRRKEEAQKITQLKRTYGNTVEFLLFLCGYFDSGYLGYEAAEGIDWIWEHRISDMEKLCL